MFNAEKMLNMILFFLSKHRHLGRTKLHALCYYADFDHYEQYGRSISGMTYYKHPSGPRSRELDVFLDKLNQRCYDTPIGY